MRLYELENSVHYRSAIETECSDSLRAMRATDKLLFRGIENFDKTQVLPQKFNTPHNRKSIGMTKESQLFLNSCLKSLNFKALRSNSICCSSIEREAAYFGPVFCIFPINGFSFGWSHTVKDFGENQYWPRDKDRIAYAEHQFDPDKPTISFDTPTSKIRYNILPSKIPLKDPEFISFFNACIDFDNTNFPAALTSGNEIWLNGKYWMTTYNQARHILDIRFSQNNMGI